MIAGTAGSLVVDLTYCSYSASGSVKAGSLAD